jgi:hypothetical protein
MLLKETLELRQAVWLNYQCWNVRLGLNKNESVDLSAQVDWKPKRWFISGHLGDKLQKRDMK